jgi:hypothetical protein
MSYQLSNDYALDGYRNRSTDIADNFDGTTIIYEIVSQMDY